MRRLCLSLGLALLVPVLGVRPAHAQDNKKAAPGKPKIAVFRLAGVHEEAADESSLFSGSKSVSLKDLVARLKKAGDDPAVKAVVLVADGAAVGSAQREELRQVMGQIRAAGKDIYSHADSLTMGQYVLLSGVSRLSVVPTGDLWITGLHGEAPYVRRLLDKLGVQPDFLTCGDYKSAAEIYMRDGPSPAAEKMQNWLLDGMYDTAVNLIAKGRGVDGDKVRAWIDGGPYSAEKAKAAGLIDAVEHRQDFEALLHAKFGKDVVLDKKYGEKAGMKLDMSSPLGLFKVWGDLLKEGGKKKSDKAAVGIVYVDGAITVGSGQASLFGVGAAHSSAIRKALDEAARDDSIKAVVLRVDSPGGSAVASEIILDATRRVKAKKPFVVSMGDVAGSGGYYVACAADVIFADESTITGSIGVVSGKLVTTGLWNKAGITFKSYKRGENAGMLASDEPFSKTERARMQGWMDDVYGVFKGHVTASRGGRLKKPLDELAGGRVYTGRQALELGLVDKIGTLQDAIHHIASEAKLTDYDVRVVPEPKGLLERLVEEALGNKGEDGGLLRADRRPAVGARTALVDLALPYRQHLDPARVRVVKAALQRLELIQQEGVILMMTEVFAVP